MNFDSRKLPQPGIGFWPVGDVNVIDCLVPRICDGTDVQLGDREIKPPAELLERNVACLDLVMLEPNLLRCLF